MKPFVLVLGIAQDGGVPHIGCRKTCCREAWKNASRRRFASSLAVIDPDSKKRWLIDASPDIKFQLHEMDKAAPRKEAPGLDGIFLTHGHIGHYLGLMQLDKAALDAKEVKVYAMPKMKYFLSQNEPWKGLVRRKNIVLLPLKSNSPLKLSKALKIEPFLVPHRAEITETVGYRIKGPNRKILFIPDIDAWDDGIEDEIRGCDMALLDGTFFDVSELGYRDIKEVPHPPIAHSIERFSNLPAKERSKVIFIHLNHTNPALMKNSKERRLVKKRGFEVAKEAQKISL